MSIISDIKIKRDEIIKIASNHKVNTIKVFGSVSREEDTSDSDIDFLIDCSSDCSLFDLVELKFDLEGLLSRKVDIVTKDSLHWSLKNVIERDAIDI